MSIEQEVKEWVEGYPEEDQKVVLEDLQRSGCVSGMVGPLIQYTDTLAFFERNKEEINELLPETAVSPLSNFPGYDEEDILCLQQHNQNLLAWLGFETVADKVYFEKYEN